METPLPARRIGPRLYWTRCQRSFQAVRFRNRAGSASNRAAIAALFRRAASAVSRPFGSGTALAARRIEPRSRLYFGPSKYGRDHRSSSLQQPSGQGSGLGSGASAVRILPGSRVALAGSAGGRWGSPPPPLQPKTPTGFKPPIQSRLEWQRHTLCRAAIAALFDAPPACFF